MVVGRTITNVRWMTKREMEDHMWYQKGVILELDDGSIIYPSQDDEGNGPGTMFGFGDGDAFYIFPPEK